MVARFIKILRAARGGSEPYEKSIKSGRDFILILAHIYILLKPQSGVGTRSTG